MCYEAKKIYKRREIGRGALNAQGAKAFGLPRSSLYYKTKPWEKKKTVKPLDPTLKKRLDSLKDYELTLGYRKTAAYINAEETEPFNQKKYIVT